MKTSTRSEVDPFIVMDVMDAARRAEAAGRHIIHMEVGQPGTPAPAGARRALAKALEASALGYTVSLGLPALRQRIAARYRDVYGIDLNPERVVITAGASGAFVLAFSALFDNADRVGLGEPGYPSYRHILHALGLMPVGIPTLMQNRFQPVPSDIPQGLKGLIVASPGNPAGTMLDQPALTALADLARDRDMALISDEIYHGLSYGFPPVSALTVADDAYVVNSFSKYFSMTGWRVGWMVVPEAHIRTVERLAQNLFICAPHASQVAALAAMDCDAELQANVAVYGRNRQIVIDGLAAAGLTRFAPPDGAFYVYVDVSELTGDARAFCADILDKAGVALTPGLDFDPVRGHQTLRISYAASSEDIETGMARLGAYLGDRR